MTRLLELLAPAGSADIGIAAIDQGADAVYVGAPRFSARANAGVALEDIRRLIEHAHLYYAKVYVALNTILTDEEIPEALKAIKEIYRLGADGLIIQDTGLLELDLPPIPLIASTQMHNDSPEKIRFLQDVGFKRVILARELSLEEISEIRQKTDIELESFVHGALCVSYSGQCYMSQAVTGRSGNRGVCSQPCRLRYTLKDGEGKSILSGKYLLSLKDLNLMNELPGMIAAGVTSFKIEGRYKEADYVKNITAAYSRALDDFIQENPEFHRSSSGKALAAFTPDPAKTFNRGYTRFFITGRREKIASLDTPKSIGELVGTVTAVGKGFFRTDCRELQNGDGICFFDKDKTLSGFQVERVEGSQVFSSTVKGLTVGTSLYRNHNIAWIRQLKKTSSRRQISVVLELRREGDSVSLAAVDEDGNRAEIAFNRPYEEPSDAARSEEQIVGQLSRTGNTSFAITCISMSGPLGFFPASILNGARRDVLSELLKSRLKGYVCERKTLVPNSTPHPGTRLDFRANIMNRYARSFYARHGAAVEEPAFENLQDLTGKEVMRSRYCIRFELGACPKSERPVRRFKEPLYITDDRYSYRLEFDCRACKMSVIFMGSKQSGR